MLFKFIAYIRAYTHVSGNKLPVIKLTKNKTLKLNQLTEVQNFLSVICIPAESELKLMASDSIREWKLLNVTSVFAKAKQLAESTNDNLIRTVDPKVALSIINNASNEKEDELQQMWAGLFVSSIGDKPNDENLIYSNLLSQLTVHEARIIKYMCENCSVSFSKGGRPMASGKSLYGNEFAQFSGGRDIEYFESLLSHINSLRLNTIKWGATGEIFRYMDNKSDYVIHLIPTLLCLNLYLKCIGYKGTINDYYKK